MSTRISFFILILVFSFMTAMAQKTSEVYYFSTIVKAPFEETTTRVKAVLKEQGFGVMTELDMDKKIQGSIEGVDMKPYRLLGVCNPKLALKALEAEPNIGLFLPCKMIIREVDAQTTEVVSIDPSVMMKMLGNPALIPVGEEVSARLQKVMEGLE